MKRILLAFGISYLATLVVLVVVAYGNRQVGQMVGKVFVWQEIEVPDYRAAVYGNLESTLPFFWGEIGQSKATYRSIRERTDYVPYFSLTTQPESDRFRRGLFVEVYDYDWSFTGDAFTKKVRGFFPVARDEIVRALEERGIQAKPKGEIMVREDRSRQSLTSILIGSFLFAPSFAVMLLLFPKKGLTSR